MHEFEQTAQISGLLCLKHSRNGPEIYISKAPFIQVS